MTDAAYAPQPWLQDFSAATDAIVKANEAPSDDPDVDEKIDEILNYTRRVYHITCRDCGSKFAAKGPRAMFCPKCREKRQTGSSTKPIETVLVKHHEPKDMTAADVPDVPSDLYTTAAEKIEKTKPIETCLVPKNDWRAEALVEAASKKEKETNTMDLAKFPSMSNRLEHPENFTNEESQVRTLPLPDDSAITDTKRNPKALASFLLDTYTDLAAKCEEQGISMGTFCAKLQELDTLVNSLSA